MTGREEETRKKEITVSPPAAVNELTTIYHCNSTEKARENEKYEEKMKKVKSKSMKAKSRREKRKGKKEETQY